MAVFSIRDAVAGDEPAFRGIVYDSLKEFGLAPDPDATDADLQDLQASYVAPGGAFLVVVDDGGIVVGGGGFVPHGEGQVELRKMYLAPQARGHGLGGRLLRELIARARGRGFERMVLETASVLKEAIALYQRFGFQRQHRPGTMASRCDQAYVLDLTGVEPRRHSVCIGLVGDFDPGITAHQAIPVALALAAERSGIAVEHEWLDTGAIQSAQEVKLFDGLWCVPGSPYHSTAGALVAIRHAREHGVPFLGTCGGFQHVILEFARNVLGWRDAETAETAPHARRAVISALKCPLIETQNEIKVERRTRLATVYAHDYVTEKYHCSYGLNPRFEYYLTGGPLHASAHDSDGEVRAVELEAHPYFIATLFQPERAALEGHCPAPVLSLVRACAA